MVFRRLPVREGEGMRKEKIFCDYCGKECSRYIHFSGTDGAEMTTALHLKERKVGSYFPAHHIADLTDVHFCGVDCLADFFYEKGCE